MSINNAPHDIVLFGTPNSDGTWTGASADETTSQAVPPHSHMSSAIIIIGNGTTSSGVLTYEEAYWTNTQMPYSGTWSTIGTYNASDVTGGAQKIVHVAPTTLVHQRVRISTAIGGGGGVSVVLRYQ